MTPERKRSSSNAFTVRLGLGPVLLAAVITFVGLAWIFFLGVMVGRMYYGNTDAMNGQRPPVEQQYDVRQTEPKDTGTTYQPVLKENNALENAHQSQENLVDTTKASETNSSTPLPLSGNTQDMSSENGVRFPNEVDGTNQTELPKGNEMSQSASDASQDTDFIEKINDSAMSDVTNTQLDSPHEHDVLVDSSRQTGDMKTQTTQPAPTTSQSIDSKIHDTQNFLDTSIHKGDATDSNLVIKASSDNNITNKTADTHTTKLDDKIEYTYRYQLASFKNADSANAITEKLVADGLNASVLQENKNGTIMYYILTYHTGTEASRKAIEDKFAQHQLTNFLMRRVEAQ